MKINKLCVVSNYYPTASDPIYSFLDEVVQEFAAHNIECHVITPISVFEKKHKAESREILAPNGKNIHIYCPRYYGVPARLLGKKMAAKINGTLFCKAALSVFKKSVRECDVIYSHFFCMGGIAAGYISHKTGIPGFVANGESDLTPERIAYKFFDNEINNLKGAVAVSSEIKEHLIDLSYEWKKNIIVLPNGVDINKFYKASKIESRNKLNIDENLFVMIFVGHFIDRKGIRKVINVLNRNKEIYGIFIGDDELPEKCDNALIVRKVAHEQLPLYYNAADVFVLPTLREGCCNAIVEAQACGLPIISSNLPFNKDILSDESALLIDPLDENEIEEAIIRVKNNCSLRQHLIEASINASISRSIKVRAASIIDFMEKTIDG